MTQQEQYHETISSTSTSSIDQHHHDNNYNNYTHASGRFLSPEQCEAIKTAYLENISDSMPGAVAHMLERAFSSGLTADEIIMAIEETGFAPRPSPWYLKAILENWVTNGVTVSKIRHLAKANNGLAWWK